MKFWFPILAFGPWFSPGAASPAACRGRCVLLDRTAGGIQLYVEELGLVDGISLETLVVECRELAVRRPDHSLTRKGVVIDHLTVTPRDGLQTVTDLQIKTSCEHDVQSSTVSEDSVRAVISRILRIAFEFAASFGRSSVH